MNRKKRVSKIRLNPESPLAKGLVMMLEHKKLRERFWRGEIALDELNEQLRLKGIKKQYEHGFAV
jgi:hypothetical protein